MNTTTPKEESKLVQFDKSKTTPNYNPGPIKTISILGVFDGQAWRQEADIKKYIEAMGYKVKTYNYRGMFNREELFNPENQDLILVLNGIAIPKTFFMGIQNHLVLWNSELFNGWNDMNSVALHNYTNIRETIPFYDALIFHEPISNSAFKALTAVPVYNVFGYGTRENIHIQRPKDKIPSKSIGFVGSLGDNRKKLIEKLNEELKPRGYEIDLSKDFITDPLKMRDFIWDHKIMLNFHYTESLNTENRIVENLGCGVQVITETLANPELFKGCSGLFETTIDMANMICKVLSEYKELTPEQYKSNMEILPKHEDLIKKVMEICENTRKQSPHKTDYSFRKPEPATISAVVITKDVSSVLERCLSSIKPYVDEIVVLDNGSKSVLDCLNPDCCEQSNIKIIPDKCPVCGGTDIRIYNPTVEIGKKYADIFEEIPEFIGFGPTRNEALKHATKDYILSIDTDEYLPTEVGEKLHDIVSIYKRDGIMKSTILLKMNPEKDGRSGNQFFTDRIFKRDPRIQWKYYVHNELNLGNEFGVRDDRIYIHHSRAEMSPHDATVRSMQRYNTNVKWLKKELEDYEKKGEDGIRSKVYLGNTNLDHGEYEEAIKWYLGVLKETDPSDLRRANVYTSVAQCYSGLRHQQENRYTCKECGNTEEFKATSPLFRCNKCKSRNIQTFKQPKVLPATRMREIELKEITYYQLSIGMNPYDPSIYVALAELQIAMGNMDGAEKTLILADTVCKNVPAANIKFPYVMGVPFHFHRSAVHEYYGRYDEAIKEINRALEIDPNHQLSLKRKAAISQGFVAKSIAVKKDRKNLLIYSPQHTFISDMIDKWHGSGKYNINLVETKYGIYPDESIMAMQLEKTDVVWFEFGNEAMILGSKIMSTMKEKPKAIVRIHGYEVHTGYFPNCNIETIDRIIFVAPYLYDIAKNTDPRLSSRRVDFVDGGINLESFSINTEKKKGNKVCFAGYLNHKKDLHNALLVIKELQVNGYDVEYHIAGTIQDPRMMNTLVLYQNKLGLSSKIFKDDWLDGSEKLNEWYADKDYFLSSSTEESLHYSLAQAMAAGLKPIIRNWESSDRFYKPEWIYSTPNDAVKVFQKVKDVPCETFRQYIQDNLSLEKEMAAIEKIIDD